MHYYYCAVFGSSWGRHTAAKVPQIISHVSKHLSNGLPPPWRRLGKLEAFPAERAGLVRSMNLGRPLGWSNGRPAIGASTIKLPASVEASMRLRGPHACSGIFGVGTIRHVHLAGPPIAAEHSQPRSRTTTDGHRTTTTGRRNEIGHETRLRNNFMVRYSREGCVRDAK